jgi:hypothetical protein
MPAHPEEDPNVLREAQRREREREEIENAERKARREAIRAALRRKIDEPNASPALDPEPELLDVDKEEIDYAIAWLQEKWGEQRACPYCGNTQWAVGPPVQFAISTEPGISPPLFSSSCTNCGNTVLVNVMYEGLRLDPEEE